MLIFLLFLGLTKNFMKRKKMKMKKITIIHSLSKLSRLVTELNEHMEDSPSLFTKFPLFMPFFEFLSQDPSSFYLLIFPLLLM